MEEVPLKKVSLSISHRKSNILLHDVINLVYTYIYSGRGIKSHSDQLSIATSKNPSVMNTIYICIYI